ncbi:MAG TPA: ethanolamine ammonia-lyase reactivating factor EutA [Micromonosporaceae bacterium]|jgi:ethanolamine utilization protein EutA
MDTREHEHPLWISDRIRLASVGIDIGSATSQTVFSTITLRRMGRELSSRYVIVNREVSYRSPIHLTPFQPNGDIDGAALSTLIAECYAEAGVAPAAVDTGVVILTGEAADRRNARIMADILAGFGGRFISVAAGHHLEGVLAAHGCGAVALSRATGVRVLTIDIGGGTTKLALVRDGAVDGTAALHLGGRLVAFDDAGRVTRIEAAGVAIARACGLRWRLGDPVPAAEVTTVGHWMAEQILGAVGARPTADVHTGLWLTAPLAVPAVDAVVVSGGVGEYVYDSGIRFRGDLGHAIGSALRDGVARLPAPLAPATARIRATVLGAAEHTVQVSGSTLYVVPPSTLPLRNVRVIRPRIALPDVPDSAHVATEIRAKMHAAGVVDGAQDVALALDWQGDPTYHRLSALAAGVRAALPGTIAAGRALCLVFDHDVAHLVGACLQGLTPPDAPAGPVVVIDGVNLSDLDFIDIGAIMPGSGTVIITIKSLVFGL